MHTGEKDTIPSKNKGESCVQLRANLSRHLRGTKVTELVRCMLALPTAFCASQVIGPKSVR